MSKHLEVCQKYSATRRIFNSLLGVWKCEETLSLGFLIYYFHPHFLMRSCHLSSTVPTNSCKVCRDQGRFPCCKNGRLTVCSLLFHNQTLSVLCVQCYRPRGKISTRWKSQERNSKNTSSVNGWVKVTGADIFIVVVIACHFTVSCTPFNFRFWDDWHRNFLLAKYCCMRLREIWQSLCNLSVYTVNSLLTDTSIRRTPVNTDTWCWSRPCRFSVILLWLNSL